MIRKHETEVPGASIMPEGFRDMTVHFALTEDDGYPRSCVDGEGRETRLRVGDLLAALGRAAGIPTRLGFSI